jgi:hypothetical protein
VGRERTFPPHQINKSFGDYQVWQSPFFFIASLSTFLTFPVAALRPKDWTFYKIPSKQRIGKKQMERGKAPAPSVF